MFLKIVLILLLLAAFQLMAHRAYLTWRSDRAGRRLQASIAADIALGKMQAREVRRQFRVSGYRRVARVYRHGFFYSGKGSNC